MKQQHIVAQLKESEFLAVSPQQTTLIVKSATNKIDVLDADTFEVKTTLKCVQPKSVLMN